MPFTPAHIAAAIPFRRSRLVWSALIVGAIAPDLPYFLRLSPGGGYSHTLVGSVVFTLPLALATLWLFHAYVKTAFAELMPNGLRRRLGPLLGEFRFGGARRFALIVASIMVGMATHLVWDSFTHSDRWLTRHWAPLRHAVRVPHLGFVPLYKLLQHASTLAGLAILLLWFISWYQRAGAGCEPEEVEEVTTPARKVTKLATIVTSSSIGAVGYAVATEGVPSNHSTFTQFLGVLAVTLIALTWWQLVALGMWQSVRRRSS